MGAVATRSRLRRSTFAKVRVRAMALSVASKKATSFRLRARRMAGSRFPIMAESVGFRRNTRVAVAIRAVAVVVHRRRLPKRAKLRLRRSTFAKARARVMAS